MVPNSSDVKVTDAETCNARPIANSLRHIVVVIFNNAYMIERFHVTAPDMSDALWILLWR